MKPICPLFVRIYPLDKMIVRFTMMLEERSEHDWRHSEYGPKGVTKAQFDALTLTTEYKAVVQEFMSEYRQFAKQHYPGRYGAITK